MKCLTLLVLLIATAIPASGAEPTATGKGRPTADRTAKTVPPAPAGRKAITSSSSIFSSDTLAMLPAPGVLYPDLIPEGTPYVSSCTWNPSAGETCESKCPPIEINLPFGTKNASNRALNGQALVRIYQRPSGQLLKEYSFNGLAAQGRFMPASIKRLLVRCPTGTSSQGTPPATHDLVIETAASEVHKDNNAKPLHLLPNDQLVLP